MGVGESGVFNEVGEETDGLGGVLGVGVGSAEGSVESRLGAEV